VEGDLELACPWVAGVERLSLDAYVLTDQNVLRLP
jgi:hypothetical protein